MSQRHRDAELPVPAKQELVGARARRAARIHAELSNVASQVSAGIDLADVHELGMRKPEHHRTPTWLGKQAVEPPAVGATEVEDVEAAHEDAPGAGGSDAPRRRTALTGSARQLACRRRIGSSHRWRSSWARASPLLGGDRAADVVLPHAVDLEHAHGDTLDAQVELPSLAGCWCCAGRC